MHNPKRGASEERIKAALGMLGFQVFPLRRWFGEGFIAIEERFANDQLNALIFRTSGSKCCVQALERPSPLARGDLLETLVRYSGIRVEPLPDVYNINARGIAYRWEYFVPIAAIRSYESLPGNMVRRGRAWRERLGRLDVLQRRSDRAKRRHLQ